MLYLVSDIHGELRDFKMLLKKLRFDREKDNMIIMGDIFDRGPESIRLLKFMVPFLLNHLMELLLGNYEMFAIMFIKGTLDERIWTVFGGGTHLKR